MQVCKVTKISPRLQRGAPHVVSVVLKMRVAALLGGPGATDLEDEMNEVRPARRW